MVLSDSTEAFEIVNPKGKSHLLLVCDHASNKVPSFLQELGLSEAQLNDHIAWDPGAADVARFLAQDLDATLVLSGFSRLVIDCNRSLISPLLIAPVSDGVVVPANQNLTEAQRSHRIESYFLPYHQAIQQLLDDRLDVITTVLSIHSFSPALAEADEESCRPWHVGVSFKEFSGLADKLYAALKRDEQLRVGYHEPYAVDDEFDFTLIEHGFKRQLQHAMIEMRQDQLLTVEQRKSWALRILKALH